MSIHPSHSESEWRHTKEHQVSITDSTTIQVGQRYRVDRHTYNGQYFGASEIPDGTIVTALEPTESPTDSWRVTYTDTSGLSRTAAVDTSALLPIVTAEPVLPIVGTVYTLAQPATYHGSPRLGNTDAWRVGGPVLVRSVDTSDSTVLARGLTPGSDWLDFTNLGEPMIHPGPDYTGTVFYVPDAGDMHFIEFQASPCCSADLQVEGIGVRTFDTLWIPAIRIPNEDRPLTLADMVVGQTYRLIANVKSGAEGAGEWPSLGRPGDTYLVDGIRTNDVHGRAIGPDGTTKGTSYTRFDTLALLTPVEEPVAPEPVVEQTEVQRLEQRLRDQQAMHLRNYETIARISHRYAEQENLCRVYDATIRSINRELEGNIQLDERQRQYSWSYTTTVMVAVEVELTGTIYATSEDDASESVANMGWDEMGLDDDKIQEAARYSGISYSEPEWESYNLNVEIDE